MRDTLRRQWLMVVLATALGLAAGGMAWLLVHLIGLLTNLALLHRWGWSLPSLAHFHPDGTLYLAALGGAAIVALLARWSPVIRGHGIPEAMEAILERSSRIAPRTAVAKPISAAVAIGTGGPFGAEGPIIVTGGALGSLAGQVLRVTASERKVLLACGAAAGMSAIFGAPLAAVVLALELLLFEFSIRAILPLAVASAVAAGVHAALFSPGPIFHVPVHHYEGLAHLPAFVVLGLLCGLLAVVVCRGLYLIEDLYRRLPIPEGWNPLVGAVGFATIGMFVPRALGVGYDSINDVLASRLALGTLAVLLLAKLGAWWIALGSGTSGGTLAPLLLIGGAFGGVLGGIVGHAVPGIGAPGAIALVAMAATFGASARAPFTAIVFAFELTGDYRSIVPLMVATVLADLVCRSLLDHGLMTEKLARRGVVVPSAFRPDSLRHTLVRDAMSTPAFSISSDATLGAARAVTEQHPHSAYPLVDAAGRPVGVLARVELLASGANGDSPLVDLAENATAVHPEDTLEDVLAGLLDERVDLVPVVDDDGCLVGICTRTDLLASRARQRDHERIEDPASWARRGRRGSRPPATPPAGPPGRVSDR